MKDTMSLCPICLAKIPAHYEVRGEDVIFVKNCPQHGSFSTVVWRGDVKTFEKMPAWEPEETGCPFACGLCSSHAQNTCCIEVEITPRCNLHCAYCFEDAIAPEPSVEELGALFTSFVEQGRTFLHLSGGEPTMREDLEEIVKRAVQAGCQYIQLNTNGVRLAQDPTLAQRLKRAGLSFVFMQFDGVDDDVYRATRGEALLDLKCKAIENCGAANLGVTLVPTLVPGVNTQQIGEIISFAIAAFPAVRGVHFQPVSYFGRYPKAPTDDMRYTIPQLIRALNEQAGISPDCFALSSCDHPMCGFHGDFIVMPDGLLSLTKGQREQKRAEQEGCCCGATIMADTQEGCCCGAPIMVDGQECCCDTTDTRDAAQRECCDTTGAKTRQEGCGCDVLAEHTEENREETTSCCCEQPTVPTNRACCCESVAEIHTNGCQGAPVTVAVNNTDRTEQEGCCCEEASADRARMEPQGCCCGAPLSVTMEKEEKSSCSGAVSALQDHQGCCCGAPLSVPMKETDQEESKKSHLPSMEAVLKNRQFVARRWLREESIDQEVDTTSLEGFYSRLKSHGFTITAMAFQDAYTVDINRLRHCSLHIYHEGKIMPFCLRYILR